MIEEATVDIVETQKVEPSEAAYLVRVRQGAIEAQQLRAQVEQALKRATALEGAFENYGAFLAEKYGLDANRDRIEDDGTINRMPKD